MIIHWCMCTCECVGSLFITIFSYQTPCHLAPGLSSNVRSYTVSVNKQTVEQEYICANDSELCSYDWNVADHETVNYTVSNYMITVAGNNVVGQGVIKNCTTTPIGEQLLNRPLSRIFLCYIKSAWNVIFYCRRKRKSMWLPILAMVRVESPCVLLIVNLVVL